VPARGGQRRRPACPVIGRIPPAALSRPRKDQAASLTDEAGTADGCDQDAQIRLGADAVCCARGPFARQRHERSLRTIFKIGLLRQTKRHMIAICCAYGSPSALQHW
jgi:hypothetical protein